MRKGEREGAVGTYTFNDIFLPEMSKFVTTIPVWCLVFCVYKKPISFCNDNNASWLAERQPPPHVFYFVLGSCPYFWQFSLVKMTKVKIKWIQTQIGADEFRENRMLNMKNREIFSDNVFHWYLLCSNETKEAGKCHIRHTQSQVAK